MPTSPKVVSLTERRGRAFLHRLAEQPFIAVVFDGTVATVYTHDIELTAASLRTIQGTLAELPTE